MQTHTQQETEREGEREPQCQQDFKGKTGDVPTVYAHSGNSMIFNPWQRQYADQSAKTKPLLMNLSP